MSFSFSSNKTERVFNNADSFAIAFDKEWEDQKSALNYNVNDQEENIRIVLKTLKDHPFVIHSPKEAEQVARFRIRLLGLD